MGTIDKKKKTDQTGFLTNFLQVVVTLTAAACILSAGFKFVTWMLGI